MLWSRVLPPAALSKASFARGIVPEIQDSASEVVLSQKLPSTGGMMAPSSERGPLCPVSAGHPALSITELLEDTLVRSR